MENEETINRLASGSPNFAQKILRWIKDTLSKLGSDYETNRLRKAERLYEKALEQAEKGQFEYEKNTERQYSKVDSEENNAYNKNKWVKDSGLVTKQEFAIFFERIGSLKRGDYYRRTKDGLYMIPTGENGIDNTIIVTDGDYVNPLIESVVKINLDNENDIYDVREAYYESKAGMHSPSNETVRSCEEEGVLTEYKRNDIWMLEDLSSADGRENTEDVGVYGNNTGKRNGKRSFGKDRSFSFGEINNKEQARDGLFFNAKNTEQENAKPNNTELTAAEKEVHQQSNKQPA